MKKNSNLVQWLNTSNKNKDTVDPYKSCYNINSYYMIKKEKDIDLVNYKGPISASNSNSENEDPYMDHIYIDPTTNRYHTNMLFRMLVDYSYNNEFDYSLHDPETNEPYANFNLMDRSLKTSFYKFCFEYS
jgi:hypothetical protein